MPSEREIGPKYQEKIDFLTNVLPGALRDGAKDCAERAEQLTNDGSKNQQLIELYRLSSSILSQAADNLDKARDQVFLQPTQPQDIVEEASRVKEESEEPETPEVLFKTLVEGRIALHSIKKMDTGKKFNPRDKKDARGLRHEFSHLDGYLPTSVILPEHSIHDFKGKLEAAEKAYQKLVVQAENIIYCQVDARSADLSQKIFTQMVSELAVEAVRIFPYNGSQTFEQFISGKIDDEIEATKKKLHQN